LPRRVWAGGRGPLAKTGPAHGIWRRGDHQGRQIGRAGSPQKEGPRRPLSGPEHVTFSDGRATSDGTVHTRLLQLATKGVSRIRGPNSRDRQMKLGRNDPCPCGSGKKYKHCCLNAGTTQAAAPTDLTWRRMRGLLDGFPTEMLRFTAEAYGPLAVHEAWDEFTCHAGIEFDPNTPLMQLFMPGSSIAGRPIP